MNCYAQLYVRLVDKDTVQYILLSYLPQQCDKFLYHKEINVLLWCIKIHIFSQRDAHSLMASGSARDRSFLPSSVSVWWPVWGGWDASFRHAQTPAPWGHDSEVLRAHMNSVCDPTELSRSPGTASWVPAQMSPQYREITTAETQNGSGRERKNYKTVFLHCNAKRR
jgi:hypothetical protein